MNNFQYSTRMRVIHWINAALWVSVWVLGVLWSFKNITGASYSILAAHKALAPLVIILTVVRLFFRYLDGKPDYPSNMSVLWQKLATFGHLSLYIFALIGLPLSGMIMSLAGGRPVDFLWLIQIPALEEPNRSLAGIAHSTHVVLGYATAILVLGHIIMAIKHHIIDKDTTLLSMLWSKNN